MYLPKICIFTLFYPPHSYFKPSQGWFISDMWYQKKLRVPGLTNVKTMHDPMVISFDALPALDGQMDTL